MGLVAPAVLRAARALSELPDRPLVDRLVRGQGWIVVVGFLLMGIVAMQVSLLKLNAGIGRSVERSAALERRNGELRAQVSRLSSGERVQARAAERGLVMPPAGSVSYLRIRGAADRREAAAALRAGSRAPGAVAVALPGSETDGQGQPGTAPGTDDAGTSQAGTQAAVPDDGQAATGSQTTESQTTEPHSTGSTSPAASTGQATGAGTSP